MDKEEENKLLKELRELREQLEAKETRGWFGYETRVDEKGRLNIPPDVREELGVFGKAAKVSVKVSMVKLYGGAKDVGSV